MRVSTDPNSAHFIDARPRRVFVNDREVIGWTTADEFRRCVETPEGPLFGSVRIERLPGDEPDPEPEVELIQPRGFHGMFVAVPDEPEMKEAPKEEEKPEPSYALATVKVDVMPAGEDSFITADNGSEHANFS
jgi:hypothetical protein